MNLSGMQVIIVSQPGQRNEHPTYRSMKPRLAKQLIGLGVVHVLIGVSCIILQSISLWKFVNINGNNYVSEYFSLLVTGHGFWSGLLFLVTGIIGIAAGIRKSNCQVVAISIFSIISAVFATILFILATASAYISFRERRKWCGNQCTTAVNIELTILLVMESMLAAMGILEGIIAISSSIVCCLIGVCSCFHASPHQTQPMILSAEQQAALMSNPMFLSNQQQSTVGFYAHQQTVQFNKQQPNGPSYAYNNSMSAATVEGSYTGLNTGMRRSITSSIYEELHDYLEVE